MLKTAAKIVFFPIFNKKRKEKSYFLPFFVVQTQEFDYFCKQINAKRH